MASAAVCAVLLVWGAATLAEASDYDYDGYSSCARPHRVSKARPQPPCDFQRQSWCTVPGSAYPWHAVRRFVQENHGLMRRMYGDQRHISVLRAEVESNDVDAVDDDDEWAFRSKLSVTHVTEAAADAVTVTVTDGIRSRDANVTASVDARNETAQLSQPPTQSTEEANDAAVASTILADITTEPGGGAGAATVTEAATTTSLGAEEEESEEEEAVAAAVEANEGEAEVEDAGAEDDKPVELFQDVRAKEQAAAASMLRLRGVNACPVKEEVVAPFWANNTRGEVLALLNLYPFEQYVHWEKCTFEMKQMYCREGCRCEQQYRLHRLLAYDPNNECRGIFSDWFKFPSCCICRCYDLPVEFQMTSRSPRNRPKPPLHWYKMANRR